MSFWKTARKHSAPRAGYRVLVRVAQEDGTKGRSSILCSSHDISVNGIRIDTEHNLPVGTQIHCTFFLPEGEQVEACGEIVRTGRDMDGSFVHGVSWLELSPEAQAAIGSFVEAAPKLAQRRRR